MKAKDFPFWLRAALSLFFATIAAVCGVGVWRLSHQHEGVELMAVLLLPSILGGVSLLVLGDLWGLLPESFAGTGERCALLKNRVNDPRGCDVAGVPSEDRDVALDMLIEAMYLRPDSRLRLRADDALPDIYRGMYGGRTPHADDLELESLAMMVEAIPGPAVSESDWAELKSVGDLIRIVSLRKRGLWPDSSR